MHPHPRAATIIAIEPHLMNAPRTIIRSPRALDRIEATRQWLETLSPAAECLILGASRAAADDLARSLSPQASFGIHRLTLNRLTGIICAERLARESLQPVEGFAVEAVVARALFALRSSGALGRLEPIADRARLASALARTIGELRMAGIDRQALIDLDENGKPLAAMLERFEHELADARLIDRAGMLRMATAIVQGSSGAALTGIPIVLLDVPLESVVERDLVATLAARSPRMIATVTEGDGLTLGMMTAAIGVEPSPVEPASDAPDSLRNLQDCLFSDETPAERPLDPSVGVISAAGEMQECVEIARRIHRAAADGIPFDRIAVALHAPERYGAHLEEALARADIPAFFARGTARPEPGGRAMLALLACAAENLSARRYAEYLSLAQVPEPSATAESEGPRNVFQDAVTAAIPDLELAAMPDAPASAAATSSKPPASDPPGVDPVPVVEGMLRAPWRWERLLIEAAVIGSRERWQRRLDGLAAELALRRADLADDDVRVRAVDRELLDLAHLRSVAIGHIDLLAALPRNAAWAEWLDHLRRLAQAAIRDSGVVLAALAELEPMGPIGPVGLDEVQVVLRGRLGALEAPPSHRRYGAVFVAPPRLLRGLVFDVVFAPGLSERIFPKKLTQDLLLADAARERLGPALATRTTRIAAERLALRLVAGAARRAAVFSYPRVDFDQGRPRVPSFYALEVLRAAEGRLPGFDELGRRASMGQSTRLGWPAPANPRDAIDAAEFDLAVLDRLMDADPDSTAGAANYLLAANEYLARALRSRARRWLRRWTPADGLVDPDDGARAALARHWPSARPYSPTALQQFAACPYRFLLYAIHRLQPREEAAAIEVIDPLTRGALVHEVQFELLTRMRDRGMLPVAAEGLPEILGLMDSTLEELGEQWHDRLAPAIERVWDDGIDAIRADLREWLRRTAEDPARWTPARFELAFGLKDRTQADPASSAEPIGLEGGLIVRGSIDLVEHGSGGALRVTDHKTGRAEARAGMIIGGGRVLQPVIYALAAERLLGAPVESGRLYYCTSRGGYEERVVPIDDEARRSARDFAAILTGAIEGGFLPAAPAEGQCVWCDFRTVCGPYEEVRVGIKPKARLAELERLRGMR